MQKIINQSTDGVGHGHSNVGYGCPACQASSDTIDVTIPTLQFQLIDSNNNPMPGIKFEIKTIDGKKISGKTDNDGKTEPIKGYTPDNCRITYINF